ncbi:uncharacterized protein RAG0_16789 [Rhynchosporium agropyri]|uniref:Uncharacterized protein n=1 Tax=Rhynchosporium agropyri TaxID=914238 RepID=A0A1E1LRX0_9HELO|nr:uncharacterized protein RAG0_16789 [Rhynchosporium agropyri]
MSRSAIPNSPSQSQYVDALSYDDSNSPSIQLQTTLHESITRSLSSRRPLLTHLNADTTWLLFLPYPQSAPGNNEKTYYHILIDPWLCGGQSDIAKFFSQQWHVEDSAVQSIAELEEAIRGIEDAAMKEAIEREKEEEEEDEMRGSTVEGLKEVRFEDLRNGESLVLE